VLWVTLTIGFLILQRHLSGDGGDNLLNSPLLLPATFILLGVLFIVAAKGDRASVEEEEDEMGPSRERQSSQDWYVPILRVRSRFYFVMGVIASVFGVVFLLWSI
jgi:hypothetical protein